MKIRNKKNWYQAALDAKRAKVCPEPEYFYDEARFFDDSKHLKGIKKLLEEAIEIGRTGGENTIDIDYEEITPKQLNK